MILNIVKKPNTGNILIRFRKLLPIIILIPIIISITIISNQNLNTQNYVKESVKKTFDDDNKNQLDDLNLAAKESSIAYNLSLIWNNVSNTPSTDSLNAKIAIDSSRDVHIVWQDEIGGDFDIRYRLYNYTSKTFGSINEISDYGVYIGNDSINPDLCVDNQGNIHITWVETISGDDNIYYRRFNAVSKLWESIQKVAITGDNERDPSIASNSTGGVAIIYTTYVTVDLLLKDKLSITYYNNGQKWRTEALYSLDNKAEQKEPDIFCYNNEWHISFINDTDAGNYYVLYQYKTNLGAWNSFSIVRDASTTSVGRPNINIISSKIFVTWQESLSGFLYIFSKNKTLVGAWPSPYNDLSGNTGSTNSYKIFDTCLSSIGTFFVCYENESIGLNYKRYSATAFEYKGMISQIPDSENPRLALNDRTEVFFTWHNNTPGDIHMRKLDTYGPQLNVFGFVNNSAIKGTKQLLSSVNLNDIASINYTYYDDTNRDGVANDGNSWKAIHYWKKGDSLSLFNYSWNTNQTGNRIDIKSALISVKAIDENGLDERIVYGGINIDNYKPLRSSLINIYDENGNNYASGKTNFTNYNGGKIHFVFNAYDNNSGWGTFVRLYYTPNVFVKSNSSNNEIVLNLGDIAEGTYNFFINSSDYAGNWNKSNTISNIRIDNTLPTIDVSNSFNNLEITNDTLITVPTYSNDILYVNYSYYLSNPNSQIYFASDTNLLNGLNFIFKAPFAYQKLYIVVNATDFAGLHNWDIVPITIDNQKPTPILLDQITTVGLKPEFNVTFNLGSSDNDTQWVSVSYNEEGALFYILAQNKTVNVQNLISPDSSNGTHFFIYLNQVDFSELDYDWTYLQVQIQACDNQGLIGIIELHNLEIRTDTPNKTASLKAQLDKYTITLTWANVPTATNYLIFRSFIEFDEEELNEKMTPYSRIKYLGSNPGEEFCIAKVNKTVTTYVDETFGPNTYYYMIIALNVYGNPSEVRQISQEIDAEILDKEIQGDPTINWKYYFAVYACLMVALTIGGLKRVKVRFFKAKVSVAREKIEDQQVAKFEKEGLDLEATVPKGLESAIISPKKGRFEKAASIYEEKATPSFEEKATPSFEEKVVKAEEPVTIDKCPTCGWILSSTARKCPRCGWQKISER